MEGGIILFVYPSPSICHSIGPLLTSSLNNYYLHIYFLVTEKGERDSQSWNLKSNR